MSSRTVNFRDVGKAINAINGSPLLPEKRIYRCGKLDYIKNLNDLENPATIINLRREPEKRDYVADCYHIGTEDRAQNYYSTQSKHTKKWLLQVFRIFEDEKTRYPILIHCAYGKDRTGIITAVLLNILQVPREVIIEEYLISKGIVKRKWIETVLDDINDFKTYLPELNINKIRNNVLGKIENDEMS